ncbi:MAG TPA: hypothetical protein VHY83_01145 [Solirubrobacteraceae bacterium]|jgi:hypothetical protein|nr:hypothetical protein [Solirubrobacteraceae bacterium]
MVWFIASALVVLLGWALWPLVSLRSYRAREGAQQFVTLEYSGLPVKVDLQAIPSARSPRRRTARPGPLSAGAGPR